MSIITELGYYKEPVITRDAILEIANLFKNKDSTVRIISTTPGAKFKFTAFIDSPFQMQHSNTFTSDLEGSVPLLTEANKGIKSVAMAAGNIDPNSNLAKAIGSSGVRSAYDSLQSYTSSMSPIFNVSCFLIAYDHSVDIVSSCINLASMCMPYKQNALAYMAPLKYQPQLTDTNLSDLIEFGGNREELFNRDENPLNGGAGTLSLGIGRFFFGTGLIAESLSYGFSLEKVDDGSPLFATISFAMKPKITPDFFQYRNYFHGYKSKTFTTTVTGSNGAQAESTYPDLYNTAGLVADKAKEGAKVGLTTLETAYDNVKAGLTNIVNR